MTDSSPPVSIGMPPLAPHATRTSTWKCRLPVEIMALVLEFLVAKQDSLGTIGAIQQTSSALYTVTTPYLYRHVQLDQPCAVRLFGLFNTFPQSDNLRFFHSVPKIHLMDMHVADRLRTFLSYTTVLTLQFWEEPFVASPGWQAGLKRCHDLVVGLSAFGASTLWPLLERCDINIGEPSDHPAPWNTRLMEPEEYEPFFNAIFAKLHPRDMSIRFPDLDGFDREEHPETWETCQKTLSADNITYIDYEPSALQGLPHASSTLTLRFVEGNLLPGRFINSHIKAILRHCYALRDIQELRIVGLLVTRKLPPGMNCFNDENVLHVFDRITHCITDLMSYRLQEGNLKDLDIAVIPDRTPESEDEVHWHTYKQPEAVTQ